MFLLNHYNSSKAIRITTISLKKNIKSLKKISYFAGREEIKNAPLLLFLVLFCQYTTRNLHCKTSCCCQLFNGPSSQEAASTLRGLETEQLSQTAGAQANQVNFLTQNACCGTCSISLFSLLRKQEFLCVDAVLLFLF